MMGLFELLWNRRNNYRAVFQSDAGIKVLADLREFCRADTSCVVVAKDGKIDTHATVLAEGRREVWLRITEVLNLTDEQLYKLKSFDDA
jgi:hypothetical protein